MSAGQCKWCDKLCERSLERHQAHCLDNPDYRLLIRAELVGEDGRRLSHAAYRSKAARHPELLKPEALVEKAGVPWSGIAAFFGLEPERKPVRERREGRMRGVKIVDAIVSHEREYQMCIAKNAGQYVISIRGIDADAIVFAGSLAHALTQAWAKVKELEAGK